MVSQRFRTGSQSRVLAESGDTRRRCNHLEDDCTRVDAHLNFSMSKKSGTVVGKLQRAELITPYVHDKVSPKRSRALASQTKARAGGPIYIWQDADDEPGAPRSGTHTQYTHRQTAGKARLTAIIKTGDTEVPLAMERASKRVLSADHFKRRVKQWVIEVHAPVSATKISAAVARAMHVRKPGESAEHAGTVPVDTKLLKSAGEITGITDPTELVRFALSMLLQSDPSGDVMREERGAAPGFEMDY